MLSLHSWEVADKHAMQIIVEHISLLDHSKLQDPSCLAYNIKVANEAAKGEEAACKAKRDRE